jgi:hypothetical protein
MIKRSVVLSVFLAALYAGPAASAQPSSRLELSACAPHLVVLAMIQDRYGEVQNGVGPTEDGGQVWEVLVDPEDGSWTLLVVFTDGNACLVASGKSWEHVTGRGESG